MRKLQITDLTPDSIHGAFKVLSVYTSPRRATYVEFEAVCCGHLSTSRWSAFSRRVTESINTEALYKERLCYTCRKQIRQSTSKQSPLKQPKEYFIPVFDLRAPLAIRLMCWTPSDG